jgi:hypothetical protein
MRDQALPIVYEQVHVQGPQLITGCSQTRPETPGLLFWCFLYHLRLAYSQDAREVLF